MELPRALLSQGSKKKKKKKSTLKKFLIFQEMGLFRPSTKSKRKRFEKISYVFL